MDKEIDFNSVKSEMSEMVLQTKTILKSILDSAEDDKSIINASLLQSICSTFKLLDGMISKAETQQKAAQQIEAMNYKDEQMPDYGGKLTEFDGEPVKYPFNDVGKRGEDGNLGVGDLKLPDKFGGV